MPILRDAVGSQGGCDGLAAHCAERLPIIDNAQGLAAATNPWTIEAHRQLLHAEQSARLSARRNRMRIVYETYIFAQSFLLGNSW
jgi:hypothetical protein